jgi:hypothetical protein
MRKGRETESAVLDFIDESGIEDSDALGDVSFVHELEDSLVN